MSVTRRQYPFDLIESKWQEHWERQNTFRAWNPGETIPADHPFAQRHPAGGRGQESGVRSQGASGGPHPPQPPATEAGATTLPRKYYILDMFPYPSGAGLHVGHPEGYTATDI